MDRPLIRAVENFAKDCTPSQLSAQYCIPSFPAQSPPHDHLNRSPWKPSRPPPRSLATAHRAAPSTLPGAAPGTRPQRRTHPLPPRVRKEKLEQKGLADSDQPGWVWEHPNPSSKANIAVFQCGLSNVQISQLAELLWAIHTNSSTSCCPDIQNQDMQQVARRHLSV